MDDQNNVKKPRLSCTLSDNTIRPRISSPIATDPSEYSLFAGLSASDDQMKTVVPLAFEGCSSSRHCLLQTFIDRKGDPNLINSHGYSLLHVAVARSHSDCVISLLNASAEVDPFGPDGYTPLMVAVATNNVNITKLLIKKSANVHACHFDATMPLFIAAANGCCESLEVLIEARADLSLHSASGLSPLIAAALRGQTKALKILIANGAPVDCRSLSGPDSEPSLSRRSTTIPQQPVTSDATINNDAGSRVILEPYSSEPLTSKRSRPNISFATSVPTFACASVAGAPVVDETTECEEIWPPVQESQKSSQAAPDDHESNTKSFENPLPAGQPQILASDSPTPSTDSSTTLTDSSTTSSSTLHPDMVPSIADLRLPFISSSSSPSTSSIPASPGITLPLPGDTSLLHSPSPASQSSSSVTLSPALMLPSYNCAMTPIKSASPTPAASPCLSLQPSASPKRLSNVLLLWCAKLGLVDCVRVLLDAGVDVNTQERQGWTALHVLAEGLGLDHDLEDEEDDEVLSQSMTSEVRENGRDSGEIVIPKDGVEHVDSRSETTFGFSLSSISYGEGSDVEHDDMHGSHTGNRLTTISHLDDSSVSESESFDDSNDRDLESPASSNAVLRVGRDKKKHRHRNLKAYHSETSHSGKNHQKHQHTKRCEDGHSPQRCASEDRRRQQEHNAEVERDAGLRRWRHQMKHKTLAGNAIYDADGRVYGEDHLQELDRVGKNQVSDFSLGNSTEATEKTGLSSSGTFYGLSDDDHEPMPTDTIAVTDEHNVLQTPSKISLKDKDFSLSDAIIPKSTSPSVMNCSASCSTDFETGMRRTFSNSTQSTIGGINRPIFFQYYKTSKTSHERKHYIRKKLNSGYFPSKFPPKLSRRTREKKTQELVSLLLSRNANPHILHSRKLTPLHLAAAAGNTVYIAAILANNMDIDEPLDSDTTPLHTAVRSGQDAVVAFLINNGANVFDEEVGGLTALDIAVENGDIACIKAILDSTCGHCSPACGNDTTISNHSTSSSHSPTQLQEKSSLGFSHGNSGFPCVLCRPPPSILETMLSASSTTITNSAAPLSSTGAACPPFTPPILTPAASYTPLSPLPTATPPISSPANTHLHQEPHSSALFLDTSGSSVIYPLSTALSSDAPVGSTKQISVGIPRFPPSSPLISQPLCFYSHTDTRNTVATNIAASIASNIHIDAVDTPFSSDDEGSVRNEGTSRLVSSLCTPAPSSLPLCRTHQLLMHRCTHGSSILMRACASGDTDVMEMLIKAIDTDYSDSKAGIDGDMDDGESSGDMTPLSPVCPAYHSPFASSPISMSSVRLLPSLFAVDKLDKPAFAHAATTTHASALRVLCETMKKVIKEIWSDLGKGASHGQGHGDEKRADSDEEEQRLQQAFSLLSPMVNVPAPGGVDDIDDCLSPNALKTSHTIPMPSLSPADNLNKRDGNRDHVGIGTPITLDIDDIDDVYSPMPTPVTPSFLQQYSGNGNNTFPTGKHERNASISLQSFAFPHVVVTHHHPLLTSLFDLSELALLPVIRTFLPLFSLPPPLSIDINSAWSDGTTALSIAAASGKTQVCELLLKNGADVTAAPLLLPRAPLHTSATPTPSGNRVIPSGFPSRTNTTVNTNSPGTITRTATGTVMSTGESLPHLSPILKPRTRSVFSSSYSTTPSQTNLSSNSYPGEPLLPHMLAPSTSEYSTTRSNPTTVYPNPSQNIPDIANVAPNRPPTLISLALSSSKPNCAQLLINKGAKIRPQDLWIAASLGEKDVVEALLSTGLRTTWRAWNGSSVLMSAVLGGDVGVCKLLLDNRADVLASDENGHNAYTLACERGEEQIISLLKPYAPELPNCGGSILGMLSRVWGKFRKAVDKK